MAVNEVITLEVYAAGRPVPSVSTIRVQAHSAATLCKYYIFLIFILPSLINFRRL
jgi:hypothetical protein